MIITPHRFIIRMGDYAVRFHTNVTGRVFSLVVDHEASQFADPAEAIETAIRHGMPPAHVALRAAPELEAA